MKRILVAFDIDGTLLDYENQGEIRQDFKNAIKILQSQNHEVVLATGRSFQQCLPLMDKLNIKHGVFNNGNVVVKDLEIIHYEALSMEETIALINTFDQKNTQVYAYTKDYLYLNNINSEVINYLMSQTTKADYLKSLHKINQGIIAVVLYGNTNFKSPNPNFKMNHHVGEIGFDYNKAMGLEKLITGLDCNYLIALGDGDNDIEMIDRADLGIAVANASKRLKVHADLVLTKQDSLVTILTNLLIV